MKNLYCQSVSIKLFQERYLVFDAKGSVEKSPAHSIDSADLVEKKVVYKNQLKNFESKMVSYASLLPDLVQKVKAQIPKNVDSLSDAEMDTTIKQLKNYTDYFAKTFEMQVWKLKIEGYGTSIMATTHGDMKRYIDGEYPKLDDKKRSQMEAALSATDERIKGEVDQVTKEANAVVLDSNEFIANPKLYEDKIANLRKILEDVIGDDFYKKNIAPHFEYFRNFTRDIHNEKFKNIQDAREYIQQEIDLSKNYLSANSDLASAQESAFNMVQKEIPKKLTNPKTMITVAASMKDRIDSIFRAQNLEDLNRVQSIDSDISKRKAWEARRPKHRRDED